MDDQEIKRKAPLLVIAGACGLLITCLLLALLFSSGEQTPPNVYPIASMQDAFESNLTVRIMGEMPEPKPIYTLDDNNLVAPLPDEDGFGWMDTPEELPKLRNKAAVLLDGQDTFLQKDTQILDSCDVQYYLDDTILAMTWKQDVNTSAYTFLEVKIAHPSQFRRFLSDGQFGSKALRTTTEMSASVNAVAASAGDYYGYRNTGIVANNGIVYRHAGHLLDTCCIDKDGNFQFIRAGEITTAEAAQEYMDEHNIRFSLAFGPIMIQNGELCVPETYNTGEINENYSRSALCQLGELHYLVVTSNTEPYLYRVPTMGEFAQNLADMGIQTAYALDGGQTATIVMNHQLVNQVNYGSERRISDIIYFATALPDDGK